ncbi:MAG: hypothetical protein ACXWB3_06795, partial [Kaistella sp.]
TTSALLFFRFEIAKIQTFQSIPNYHTIIIATNQQLPDSVCKKIKINLQGYSNRLSMTILFPNYMRDVSTPLTSNLLLHQTKIPA